MAGWHPDCYQRAVAYVTDPAGRLLVFEHLDVEAGTQVPGGGIHDGETFAKGLQYAPLPPDIVKRAEAQINSITSGGKPLRN